MSLSIGMPPPTWLGRQYFGYIYIFYGSGSRFFPNTDPDPDWFSIRIRTQVKKKCFRSNYKKIWEIYFFTREVGRWYRTDRYLFNLTRNVSMVEFLKIRWWKSGKICINCGFFLAQYPLLNPDPYIEYGSGSRRWFECGSTRIRNTVGRYLRYSQSVRVFVEASANTAAQVILPGK